MFAQERADRVSHALELSAAYRGTAFLLGDVVEADDEYTGTHSREVVQLTVAVAETLGLDPRSIRLAELTALLHDVGKIQVPNTIINKAGPLTAEERAIVNGHTIEGERLLSQVGGFLAEVGQIVRSCHERYDGGGIPTGSSAKKPQSSPASFAAAMPSTRSPRLVPTAQRCRSPRPEPS